VHQIEALAASGFTDILINVAYKPQMFPAALGDGSQFGVSIQYSVEEEGGLETGGGIVNVLDQLGDAFLVISGDLYTGFPYHSLQRAPERLAHLVLVDPLPTGGDFGLIDGILHLNVPNMLTYANIGIYRREMFKDCIPGYLRLGDLLRAAVLKEQVTGEYFQGVWHNVGTVEEYESLNAASHDKINPV
jgi:MurNAc alpha-1-phosphate uridylyltransferase